MCDRSAESLKFSRFAFHLKSLSVFILECVFLIQTFHRVFWSAQIAAYDFVWLKISKFFECFWYCNRREDQTFGSRQPFCYPPILWSSTNSKEISELEQGESGVLRYNFSLFRSLLFPSNWPNRKNFFSFHNLVAEYFGKWFVRNLISLDFLRIVCRRTRLFDR